MTTDDDGDVNERVGKDEGGVGIAADGGVVKAEESVDSTNGVEGGVNNAAIGGVSGVSGSGGGGGGDVMEVEGSLVPAVPALVPSDVKKEEEDKQKQDKEEDKEEEMEEFEYGTNPNPNGRKNGTTSKAAGAGGGDEDDDEDEGIIDAQEVLDAQAQLDRIHLCLVSNLTGEITAQHYTTPNPILTLL